MSKSTVKKPAAKIAKKPTAKKSAPKPKFVSGSAFMAASTVPSPTLGDRDAALFKLNENGIAVPTFAAHPVPVSKLEVSLDKAQQEVLKLVGRFSKVATAEYEVKEIEVSLGFDVDGKFLGVGFGSAASIKLKIVPK